MNASLAVQMDQTTPKFREKEYEQLWTIPDWNRNALRKHLVKSQTLEFQTGQSSGVQTKWKIGLKINVPLADKFYLYWTLVEAQGFPNDKVEVSTIYWLLREGSLVLVAETPKEILSLGQMVGSSKGLDYNAHGFTTHSWINSKRELTIKLKLTIMEPDEANLRTELFHKASFVKVRAQLAGLIGDQETADLKIKTKDGKELLAHKIILKAQCPVFETMFRSDLVENRTGIVNVEDVSAKTMGIFLHLFYTGELLPVWMDEDTVVEFVYAVGKYKLTGVLKLMDEVLGIRDDEDAFHTDIKLLDLARKLDLKKAEKDLLVRIKKAMNKVENGDDFFALYGNNEKE